MTAWERSAVPFIQGFNVDTKTAQFVDVAGPPGAGMIDRRAARRASLSQFLQCPSITSLNDDSAGFDAVVNLGVDSKACGHRAPAGPMPLAVVNASECKSLIRARIAIRRTMAGSGRRIRTGGVRLS